MCIENAININGTYFKINETHMKISSTECKKHSKGAAKPHPVLSYIL